MENNNMNMNGTPIDFSMMMELDKVSDTVGETADEQMGTADQQVGTADVHMGTGMTDVQVETEIADVQTETTTKKSAKKSAQIKETPKPAEKKKRRKKLSNKENIGARPAAVTLYKKNGQLYKRKVKSGEFVPEYIANCTKRQETREAEHRGFAKKLHDYKIKTGDEGLLTLKDKDRVEDFSISTVQKFDTLLDSPQAQTQATPGPSSSGQVPPSFWEVAALSPEKPVRIPSKPTARKIRDSKHCRICNIKYESAADIESNSPWMGCNWGDDETETNDNGNGKKKKRRVCSFWVHTVCWGLQGSEEAINDLKWYCPDHNTRGKTIKALAEQPASSRGRGRGRGRGGRRGVSGGRGCGKGKSLAKTLNYHLTLISNFAALYCTYCEPVSSLQYS